MNLNKLRGDLFEEHVANLLTYDGSIALPWKNISPKILLDSNLCLDLDLVRAFRVKLKNNPDTNMDENPLMDVGVDILQIIDGKYVFIQCKYGYENGIGMHDLNGFFMQMLCNETFSGAIYHTSRLNNIVTNALARYDSTKVNVVGVKIDYVCPLDVAPAMVVTEPVIVPAKKVTYALYDYQQKAVTDLTEHLKTNDRCILSFPCSCGKTITSYHVALNYKYVFIVSPYKSHAEQNLERFEEYGGFSDKVKHVLISSDGTRDVECILTSVEGFNRVVMSSTFCSVDVVNKLIARLGGDYIVILDEFHNLSASDVGIFFDDEDEEELHEPTELNKLITTSKRTLFVSATPRVYDIEGFDSDEFNEKMFGKVIATMPFSEAIGKRYITNYSITIPSIGENNDDLKASIKKDIGIEFVENDVTMKCVFLMKAFSYHGNKKCIIYCRSNEEIDEFEHAFRKLDEYYAFGLNYHRIVADVKNRAEILKQFSDEAGISVIFSIRTLDECIDVPKCDSIYISYPSKSLLRNIQRLFRCTRKDKDNKNKIGRVFVYCNDYDEIVNMFASLKDKDVEFTTKVNVMNLKLGAKRVCESENVKKNMKMVADKYFVDLREYTTHIFNERFEQLTKYMDEHKKPPPAKDELTEIKRLYKWMDLQKLRYKSNNMSIGERNKWITLTEHYAEYLKNNVDRWYDKIKLVDGHFAKHNKRPTSSSDDEQTVILAQWIGDQFKNYNNLKYIMKKPEIRLRWERFIKEHEEHFLDSLVIWKNKLKQVDEYIVKNGERPQSCELSAWINSQLSYYTNKLYMMQQIEIKQMWEWLVEKHHTHFLDNVVSWLDKLNRIEEFITINGKLPPTNSDDIYLNVLGTWLSRQSTEYVFGREVMRNIDVRNAWERFVELYGEKHLNILTSWNDELNRVYEHIENNKHNKNKSSNQGFPSPYSNNPQTKYLGLWVCCYKTHYKNNTFLMKNIAIKQTWERFLNTYEEHFWDDETCWMNKFNLVKAYVEKHNKDPLAHSKDSEVNNLGKWVRRQHTDYATQTKMMKNNNFREIWIQFVMEHKQLYGNVMQNYQ